MNGEGATGSPPAVFTDNNGRILTAPAAPTRTGFTFNGWWTTAAEGGAQIVFGAAGTVLTDDSTIFARWTAAAPDCTHTFGENPVCGTTVCSQDGCTAVFACGTCATCDPAGEITWDLAADPWGDGVTQEGDLLRLAIPAGTQAALLANGGSLRFEGMTFTSNNRYIWVWTDLSGDAEINNVTEFAFANDANRALGFLIRTDALNQSATASIDIPASLLVRDGTAATVIYIAVTALEGGAYTTRAAEFRRLNTATLVPPTVAADCCAAFPECACPVWKLDLTKLANPLENDRHLSGAGYLPGVRRQTGDNNSLAFNGTAVHWVVDNAYRDLNIETGTGVGGSNSSSARNATDSFNPVAGQVYTLKFDAAVLTLAPQLDVSETNPDGNNPLNSVRVRANSPTSGTRPDYAFTADLTTTAQTFYYSWTQGAGDLQFGAGGGADSGISTIVFSSMEILPGNHVPVPDCDCGTCAICNPPCTCGICDDCTACQHPAASLTITGQSEATCTTDGERE
jgi:uncharacterized repeat protein (TIGR02543 family)